MYIWCAIVCIYTNQWSEQNFYYIQKIGCTWYFTLFFNAIEDQSIFYVQLFVNIKIEWSLQNIYHIEKVGCSSYFTFFFSSIDYQSLFDVQFFLFMRMNDLYKTFITFNSSDVVHTLHCSSIALKSKLYFLYNYL